MDVGASPSGRLSVNANQATGLREHQSPSAGAGKHSSEREYMFSSPLGSNQLGSVTLGAHQDGTP